MFYQAFSRLVNHTDLTFEALQIQNLQSNTEQVGSRGLYTDMGGHLLQRCSRNIISSKMTLVQLYSMRPSKL